jgi:3-isopropylmalate dehydrogenase
LGGAAIDQTGSACPQKTLDACKNADGILLGAVGGPKWTSSSIRPEQGLLALRKELDLYANIRPCYFPGESLIQKSPLKESIVKGTKFTVVRELTGGLYFGERQEELNGKGISLIYSRNKHLIPWFILSKKLNASLELLHN